MRTVFHSFIPIERDRIIKSQHETEPQEGARQPHNTGGMITKEIYLLLSKARLSIEKFSHINSSKSFTIKSFKTTGGILSELFHVLFKQTQTNQSN